MNSGRDPSAPAIGSASSNQLAKPLEVTILLGDGAGQIVRQLDGLCLSEPIYELILTGRRRQRKGQAATHMIVAPHAHVIVVEGS